MCFTASAKPAPMVTQAPQVTPPAQNPEGNMSSTDAANTQKRKAMAASGGGTIATSPLGATNRSRTTNSVLG